MPKPPRILAIETSSPQLSLALGTATELVKIHQGQLEWRHAESLLEGMQDLCLRAKWPVQSLTGVLVSTGPGSFTGIRIGLAAARTLGQALKIPVVGVSSLETIGFEALKPGLVVCPMINALRGDVFTALYSMDRRGQMQTLWKPTRQPRAEVVKKLQRYARPAPRQIEQALPQAAMLWKLGVSRLRRARPTSYQRVLPLYLRDASARERQAK